MPVQSYTKEFVAQTQIHAAIRLYAEGDYLAAITLAGAAEEILGKLVEEAGRTNALSSLQTATAELHRYLYGEPLEPKVIADRANAARNSLKHLRTQAGNAVEFDPVEQSVDMLDRAITNYWTCMQALTPAMENFERHRRAG